MRANQTLVANDGKEVALFPMPFIYMTQNEGGNYSHWGTYNIDVVGFNGTNVISRAPVYAPVTMKVISYSPSFYGGHAVIFESVDKVHLPNGVIDYLTVLFMHDNNPPYTQVGQIVNQGQLCYHTGTYGQVTGDHLHTCLGRGQGGHFVQREGGNWDLSNRVHYWDGCFINDTEVIVGYGHNWVKWEGGGQPKPSSKTGSWGKKGYPWAVALNHWHKQIGKVV